MLASVVIPTRDAADQLLYTLFSLNLQLAPFDQFEVIVVDNASRDQTPQKIRQFAAHYSLQYIRFARKMPLHRLLRAGLAKSAGQIIVFLSGNMLVPRDFVGTHQHAHQQEDKLVLLGLDTKRIYSVYDPGFHPVQHAECSLWLEQYPQIKRPYDAAKIIPLLEEHQIVSGLPFHIALPGRQANLRIAVKEQFGARLEKHPSPWTLFHTRHVSLPRRAIPLEGGFPALPRVNMERDLARRLWRNGYRFQFAEKLTLLWQERAMPYSDARPNKNKRRRA